MYNIEDSNFEEFKSLCSNSFEDNVSSKDCYDGYLFTKLNFNDKPLIICGTAHIQDDVTNEEVLYLCFAISKDIINHKRALLIVGHDFLDFMNKSLPLKVFVEQNNDTFNKFVQHFGFKCTNFVEKNEESGIIYNVYIRS